MKKRFTWLLLLIFGAFAGFSCVFLFHSDSQRQLEKEVKTLSVPLTEIHELFFQAKSADEARYKILAEQIHEKLTAYQETLSNVPETLPRLIVLPKYVLLLHFAGMKEDVAKMTREGISSVEQANNPEIETALYINWSECALECGDYENYELCFRKASERMKASSNSRWKDDMAKTLENLRILGVEKQSKSITNEK